MRAAVGSSPLCTHEGSRLCYGQGWGQPPPRPGLWTSPSRGSIWSARLGFDTPRKPLLHSIGGWGDGEKGERGAGGGVGVCRNSGDSRVSAGFIRSLVYRSHPFHDPTAERKRTLFGLNLSIILRPDIVWSFFLLICIINFENNFGTVNYFNWTNHQQQSCTTYRDLQFLFWSFLYLTLFEPFEIWISKYYNLK